MLVRVGAFEAATLATLLGVKLRAGDDDAAVTTKLLAGAEVMARRDWAVRVLDAWRRLRPKRRSWRMHGLVVVGVGPAGCWVEEADPEPGVESSATNHGGNTEDAARLAAAEAVYPELPESVRAELGARP